MALFEIESEDRAAAHSLDALQTDCRIDLGNEALEFGRSASRQRRRDTLNGKHGRGDDTTPDAETNADVYSSGRPSIAYPSNRTLA